LGTRSSVLARQYQPHEPTAGYTNPLRPKTCLQPTARFARRKRMSAQVTNKGVAEESRLPGVQMALPPSTSASDNLLSRIAILLFILVAGLLTLFGYYGSSICI